MLLKLADIDQIDEYGPVIELGEHRQSPAEVHLDQSRQQPQQQRDHQQRTVLLAQDTVDLRDEALLADDCEQRLHSEVLGIRADEPIVGHVVVQVIVDILCPFAVVDEAVADLVQEFEGRNLDTVQFSVAQDHIERLLCCAPVLFEEVVVKYLHEEVPGHDSDTSITALSEPDQPTTGCEVGQVFLSR